MSLFKIRIILLGRGVCVCGGGIDILGIEPRVFHMPGNHSIIELHTQPLSVSLLNLSQDVPVAISLLWDLGSIT